MAEDGYAVEADVDDPVPVTEFALSECRRLSVTPLDLGSHRASLDDVFLRLTGQAFSEVDETGHAEATGHVGRAEPAGETVGHGGHPGAGEHR